MFGLFSNVALALFGESDIERAAKNARLLNHYWLLRDKQMLVSQLSDEDAIKLFIFVANKGAPSHLAKRLLVDYFAATKVIHAQKDLTAKSTELANLAVAVLSNANLSRYEQDILLVL